MTTDAKQDRIQALQETIAHASRVQSEAYAAEYEAQAELDELWGDEPGAAFHRALAEVYEARMSGDPERMRRAEEAKERTYLRTQALRCLTGNYDGIDEPQRPAIRAEVERILAERDAAADAELLADRPSHETAAPEFNDSPAPSVNGTNHQPGAQS